MYCEIIIRNIQMFVKHVDICHRILHSDIFQLLRISLNEINNKLKYL